MNKLTKISTIDFPTRFDKFDLTTYETQSDKQPQMRFVMVLSTKELPEIPVVRIQSSCLFGETFHNLACDCGEQLEQSLKLIGDNGGLFFYLDQEGRGHGIINKVKELALQQTEGLDTVEASERLNLAPDERSFTIVAEILKQMNISGIKLITNNPKKVNELGSAGIKVFERIPLQIPFTDDNIKYLSAKRDKLGHMLSN